MAFEDDSEDALELSQDGQGAAQTVGFSSSRGATNPYTGQLQALLNKYLEQTEKSATDKQALLDQARERIMARSAGPDSAEMAFRIAAALGKPTRTGGFGETLGNVAETTSEGLSQRRKAMQELEDLNLKYQLAAADVKGESQKAQIGALSALARSTPKDRLTEMEKLQEIIEDPKASEGAKKNAQARINYLTTRGGGTSEIDRLVAAIEDPKTSPTAKRSYEARLRKLTYIAPEAKAERDKDKPMSPAGKLASDEGLVPGTPEYQKRVKQLAGEGKGVNLSATEQKELFEAEDVISGAKNVILNLNQAKQISPKAYEGMGAGVRRTIARNTPGVGGSEGVTATTELETLVGQNALDQLKAIFGGAPTEGERKILLDLQGSLSMSDAERQKLYDRAITAAARRLKQNEAKMKRIKEGAYSRQSAPEANAEGGLVGYAEGGMKKSDDKTAVEKALKWLESQGISPSDLAAVGRRSLPVGAALYSGELNSNEAEELRKRRAMPAAVDEKADGGVVGYAAGGAKYNFPKAPVPSDDEINFANLGRAVGQGLGFGFGDEAIAKVRAKMEGRPYEDVVKEERDAYARFQEKHPFVALGTEIVSGAVPTIGMAMIPGGGAPTAAVGATRMGQAASKFMQYLPKFMTGTTGKAATAAGTSGMISGAGTATEGERTSGAVTGGLEGVVLGPTVAKGLEFAGKGVKAVKNAIKPSANAVEEKATTKVLEAMARDEMDPQALRDKMLADKKLGVSSTIMDATPSLSTLGEAVVTRPGPGRKILGQGLNERLEGGREAVGARTLKDVAKGVDYTAQEDKLIGKLRANANNLYDQAYAHGSVDDTRILKVLEDDTFKKAFREAQAISQKEARAAELRGEDPSRFLLKDIYDLDDKGNMVSVGKIPDVRTLDYIKRGIDALIDKGYKGEGMSKAEANALKDLRKAYINVIDENVPEYAAARAKYAGDMEVLDALRLGRTDYLSPKMLPAEAQKLVQGMSDAERDALRAGAAQSILTKILEAPQQVNAAQRIIGAPATRKRLEALFQDPNEYKVFEAALQRESELFRNAQDIVRGSRTANKTEALKDLKSGHGIFDIAGEAIDVAAGSPGSVVGRVLKYLQARTSLDEKTAGEVAKMLKSGSQQEVDDVLKRLESSSAKFLEGRERSAKRQKDVASVVGRVAPTTPKAPEEKEELPPESDEETLNRLLEKYKTEE